MSYDIYLFRLRPDMTIDEARQVMKEALEREADDDEDDEEDEIALVADPALTEDELLVQLRKPWLRRWVNPAEWTPSFRAWLEAPEDGTEMSDEDETLFARYLSYFSEWESPPGSVLFCFSSSSTSSVLPRFWEFAKEVRPMGYLVFDPQRDEILDPLTDPPPF